MKKKTKIAVLISGTAVVVLLFAASLFTCGDMFDFFPTTKLTEPSQCHTELLKTSSCVGEDRTFKRCDLYFRADGIPKPDLCQSFLYPQPPMAAAAPDAALDAAAERQCAESSPTGWDRVPCDRFNIKGDFACFSCQKRTTHDSWSTVQAFTPSCDRGVVLEACNADLTKLPR